MCNCYWSERHDHALKHNGKSDAAFMGRTHSTSAVALFLMSVAFLPAYTQNVLGSTNLWVIIAAGIAVAGASLLPDLDNTSSTARNSLGPIGHVFSELLRGLSVVIQTSIRTSRDSDEPNAHRGALHTIPAALVFGLLAYGATKVPYGFTLPALGELKIAPLVVFFVLCHLMLASLFKSTINQLGKSIPVVGELAEFGVSILLAAGLLSQLPVETTGVWLGVAVFTGYLIHLLGDAFTTSGVPILFPIPRKGKLWWMVRFTSMKAGGALENVVFVPFFLLLIAIAAFRILSSVAG